MPFEEIISRAESGPRLAKSMEQLTSAIMKGLREETVAGTPEIYEQLFKMCWEGDPESRPPLEVVEETLQMLVVVEPMDMLMLPGEDLGMSITTNGMYREMWLVQSRFFFKVPCMCMLTLYCLSMTRSLR